MHRAGAEVQSQEGRSNGTMLSSVGPPQHGSAGKAWSGHRYLSEG